MRPGCSPICRGRSPMSTLRFIQLVSHGRLPTYTWQPPVPDPLPLPPVGALPASRALAKLTMPQPLERPSCSNITSAWLTSPAARKWSLRSYHEVSHDRLPTYTRVPPPPATATAPPPPLANPPPPRPPPPRPTPPPPHWTTPWQ